MRVKLEITKVGKKWHEGVCESEFNASFGKACTDVWVKVEDQCDAKATSIGTLMDSMHESVIDEIQWSRVMLKGCKSRAVAEGEPRQNPRLE